MKSRFEKTTDEIKKHFNGPFPLDAASIDAIVDPRPGIYIWSVISNETKYGYVGQSNKLSIRLKRHAKDVSVEAHFYFKYINLKNLDAIENYWIFKAGDINKR